eukprot:10412496-Ditylum_brightwellii.AAC.1
MSPPEERKKEREREKRAELQFQATSAALWRNDALWAASIALWRKDAPSFLKHNAARTRERKGANNIKETE